MPVKYVELGLLYAPPGRALFQELFQEAKGRGIECGQCSTRKSNASFKWATSSPSWKIVRIPRVYERQERLTFPINLPCVFRHELVPASRNAMHNVTTRRHRGNTKSNMIKILIKIILFCINIIPQNNLRIYVIRD